MRSHLALASAGILVAGLGLAVMSPSAGAVDAPAVRTSTVTNSTAARAAGTSTTIGSLAPNPATASICSTGTVVQNATVTPGQYVVPAGGGVVTSWSTSARASGTGLVRLVFMTPAGSNWVVVAKSTLQTLTPSVVNTFPVRIPVPAGALLGTHHTGSQACATPAPAGNTFSGAAYDPDTATGPLVPTSSGNYFLNITATIESDADGDGYGDVTQDSCPQSALTQAACPVPDTTVTKQPDKRTFKRKPKIKFTSTVAGATFMCSIDSNQMQPCTSPLKKRYSYGKHVINIAAVSFGNVDPTPSKVKFKVLRPES